MLFFVINLQEKYEETKQKLFYRPGSISYNPFLSKLDDNNNNRNNNNSNNNLNANNANVWLEQEKKC